MSIFKTPYEHPLAEAVLDKHVLGLHRAAHFADALVQNGKWAPEKRDEAQRAALEKYIEDMPMEMYDQMRKTGAFQQYHELTGHDGTRSTWAVQQDRRAVLNDLAAEAFSDAWIEGHIDDGSYVGQMRGMRKVPERIRDQVELLDVNKMRGQIAEDEASALRFYNSFSEDRKMDAGVEIYLHHEAPERDVEQEEDPQSKENRETADWIEQRQAKVDKAREAAEHDRIEASNIRKGIEPFSVVETTTVDMP